MEDRKNKSNRRTNAAIEQVLLKATETVVGKYGFENTTLHHIIKEAGMEPNTFYRRYKNLDDLFDQFVKHYDYFLGDVMKIQSPQHTVNKDFVANKLKDLANKLYPNKVMQKILIWELSNHNKTTQRIATQREEYSQMLVENINQLFPELDFNLRVYISIMIGGIYYLILHKDLSTFCGVNYSQRAGKIELLETIQRVTEKVLLADETNNKQLLEIARKMKLEDIEDSVITKVTGLSAEVISGL